MHYGVLLKYMSQRGLIHHMIINVSNVQHSSPFYKSLFGYLGYELAGSSYTSKYSYEDWKRWDQDTPHEISICQAHARFKEVAHVRGAVGHHDHIAFCAENRADVDRLHRDILLPLVEQGLCIIEDSPCDCPEYSEGYYATYFTDPDGLKYEFVFNPTHLLKKNLRS